MSATEQFVDVTYRGLEVGKRLKLSEVAPTTAYLELSTPLPVGAKLSVATDEGPELEVCVVRIHEQVAGADRPPGMRIRVQGLRGEAERWWKDRITSEDPDLPDAGAPAEEVAASPAGDQAAEGSDGQSTDVMSTEELRSVTGEGEGEGSNGEPPGRRTVKMSSEELKSITGSAKESGGGESGEDGGKNGRDGKRKRKRRSRKKKKS